MEQRNDCYFLEHSKMLRHWISVTKNYVTATDCIPVTKVTGYLRVYDYFLWVYKFLLFSPRLICSSLSPF